MRWKGNQKFKEVITDDGYRLIAQYVKESKYWWIVYKNGEIIIRAQSEADYAKSIQLAQSKARQRMIKHLIKT